MSLVIGVDRLEYFWHATMLHDQQQRFMGKNIQVSSRSILWFTKGKVNRGRSPMTRSSRVTDGFGLVPGLLTDMREVLDLTNTHLGLARLVHFLALAYVIGHSGLTQLLRRTWVFSPLALMGRHSLPVFATGCVLTAIGEVIVETRPEDFSYPLTLGAAIVAGGVLAHYAVARMLARPAGLRVVPTDTPSTHLPA
jgi:hypothetical protein